MYLSFYNLLDKPFATQPDPAFLWLGPKHAEALAMLRHGTLENKGFALLTGDAGTGKTTLIHALTRGFVSNVAWAVISDPSLERLDFYNAIARGFGIDREFSSKVQFLLQFSAFLHKAHDAGKRVVLLVDDCHRLGQDMLEELRLLSNIEKADAKLINIFFAGRGEFMETLIQPNNRAVRQRLTLKAELVPLSRGETEGYIRHRLKVAGTAEELFTAKAIEVVHRAARGNPRLINMICDQAMAAGAATGNRLIGLKIVEDCLAQLNLPHAARDEGDVHIGEKKREVSVVRGLLGSDGPRWRWVKYGLGVVLVGGAAGWFWLQPGNIGDTAPDKGASAVQQPAGKEKVRDVSRPAVGRLEPIGKAIDLNIVADRTQTIVRKGDEGAEQVAGGTREEQPAERGPGQPEKLYPVAPGPEPATTEQPVEEKVAAGVRQTPVEPVSPQEPVSRPESAGEPGEKAVETPPHPAVTEEKTVVAEEPDRFRPMQPVKIVLPLLPNSLELTEDAAKDYREFMERLKEYPKAKLLVKGFVSAKTNSPENVKLSEERAMGVHKLLVESGIDPARITVKGMGNLEPIASNDTSEGRTKNRRVEVEVVDDGR